MTQKIISFSILSWHNTSSIFRCDFKDISPAGLRQADITAGLKIIANPYGFRVDGYFLINM